MKRRLIEMTCAIFGLAVILGTAGRANAELVQLDSSSFTWKYEMNYNPSDVANVDLDSNGYNDFDSMPTTNPATPTFADGICSLNTRTPDYNYYWISDLLGNQPNGIWANSGITTGTGYTIELRAKITSSSANAGAFYLRGTTATNLGAQLCFGQGGGGQVNGHVVATSSDFKYGLAWGTGNGTGSFTQIDDSINSDDFHTFRLVQKPNASAAGDWLVYRDGVLISDQVTNSYTSSTRNCIILGDSGVGNQGIEDFDYVRFTAGAYAPVPEPSSVAILASAMLGLVAYAWRKRK